MTANSEVDPTEPFLISVPSNSPNPSGAPNKPQQFTISTQYNAQLKGRWEVALVEIQYPNNWFNFKEDVTIRAYYDADLEDLKKQTEKILKPTLPDAAPKTETSDVKTLREIKSTEIFTVPAGYYKSLQELIDKINQESKILRVAKAFGTDKIEISPLHQYKDAKPSYIVVEEKGLNLLAILGFSKKEKAQQLPIVADKQASLDMHFPALYLYCNFIDYQYVGNERAPLLRIIPITGKTGEYVSIEFQKPYYLTLSTGYINSLSFEIRDDTGEFVKFQSGKVTLILHFRPKRI